MYDQNFFKCLLYVLRYDHLGDALLSVENELVLPRHLLALATDPNSAQIQSRIHELAGQTAQMALLWDKNSEFLNMALPTFGYSSFDAVFARVLGESEKPNYSEQEKDVFTLFVQTYLPLASAGLLPMDYFISERKSTVVGKLVPESPEKFVHFSISDNVFDNWQFSWAARAGVLSDFAFVSAALSSKAALLSVQNPWPLLSALGHLKEHASPSLTGKIQKAAERLAYYGYYSAKKYALLEKLQQNPEIVVAWQNSDGETDLRDQIELLKSYRNDAKVAKLFAENKSEISKLKSEFLGDIGYEHLTARELLSWIPEEYAALAEKIRQNELVFTGNLSVFNQFLTKPEKKPYKQIPEELKIHNFVNELTILRDDELGGDFAKFLPDHIVGLIDKRVTEFSQKSGNLNPSSRMSKDNWVYFMKLGGRLKRLFAINGGDTAILDTVISLQSVFDRLEKKLASKAKPVKSKNTEVSDLYGPGPYQQIPDKLELHEYVKQLQIFKEDELKGNYKDFLAVEILDKMDSRIKLLYQRPVATATKTSRMTTDNLVSFMNLHSKLKRLFAINGAHTSILDTLLYLQLVFDGFEAKKEKSVLAVYKQIPDDVFLEEYSEELEALEKRLGQRFGNCSSEEVLLALNELTDSQPDQDKRIILRKLGRNIRMLFKHNHNQTFVLDNVLISKKVFDALGRKNNEKQQYRSLEQVLRLAQNLSKSNFRSAAEVLKDTLNREAENLKKEHPKEYAALRGLTAEKIRESYKKPLDKGKLQEFMQNAKQKQLNKVEQRLREHEAYEYSRAWLQEEDSKKLAAPGGTTEFLVITPDGNRIRSRENPMGKEHVPDKMVNVLEQVSARDLPAVTKQLNSLEKHNWKLIGVYGDKKMLVLSRTAPRTSRVIFKTLRSALAVAGTVFLAMLALNVWLDDVQDGTAPEIVMPPLENFVFVEKPDVEQYEREHQAAGATSGLISEKQLTPRKTGVFWK